jgi:SpoVK/Ycf46/Vps4 family AAA+-type ATPase
VNKYIGETERNLARVFARAEEQDVILLLDEGDSLLTGRTDVRTSNDRYANMETNYLLQRLESYEGILVVTTNALGRIDKAFQRRIDVHVEFTSPDSSQRYRIWQLHLPPDHAVPEWYLGAAATKCTLSGGQIRNAALQATFLAVNDERPLDGEHLAAAIAREYRKMGASSPLAMAP